MQRKKSPKIRQKFNHSTHISSPNLQKSSKNSEFLLFSDTSQTYHKPILILLCSICYGITINGDFVFDDAEAIVNNGIVRSGDFFNLWRSDFWGRPIRDPRSHKSYRPLTTLTFMLEHAIFGFQPLPYHFFNICLHTITTLLVYSTVEKICSKFEFANIKFLTSIIFAVHPIHSEAVSNLVGRAEILMSIFFLLSLQKFMQILVKPQNFFDFIELFTLSTCAMLSKEQGIMIFLVCIILDIILTYQKKEKNLLNFFKRIFLCSLCFGALVWTRLWINGFQDPKFSVMDNPAAFHPSVFYRAINYMYIWIYNIWLLLVPSQLCFDYSMGCIPLIESLYEYRILILLATIMGFIIMGLTSVKIMTSQEKKLVLFSSSFVVLTFLPASNLLATVGFVVAERVLYLPSFGYCLLVSIFVKKFEKVFKNLKTFVLILLAIMAAKCIERSKEWNDELKLYSSSLNVCPNNAKVHYNIAKVLANRGDFGSAEEEYLHAISLNPTYEQALNNLALLFEKRGLLEKSEAILKNSLKIKPDFATAWMNLGIVQLKLDKFEDSENNFYEALRRRPKHADTLFNLGNLFLKQNRLSEAKNCWHNATSLEPKHLGAWINLFILLEEQDECLSVEFLAPLAFEHHPHSPVLHSQYGLCMAKLGDFEAAEESLKKAIELDSKNAMFWGNLGTLYHRSVEYVKSRKAYEKSLLLEPTNLVVKHNYEKLLEDIRKSI